MNLSLSEHIGFGQQRGPALVLSACLIVLALVGSVSFHQYNVLPADGILDGALFVAATVGLRSRLDKWGVAFAWIAACYVIVKYILMLIYRPANPLDFMLAYKAYIYIVPLSLFIGRGYFHPSELRRIFSLLLLLFLIKYGYVRFVHTMPTFDNRPGIFTENNFELVLLLILYYLTAPYLVRSKFPYFVILAVVVFLSLSRSALVELLIIYLFTFARKMRIAAVLAMLVLLLLGALVWQVFEVRMHGGIGSIDRVRFLMIFIHEVRNWNFTNFLFGTIPLTPLSPESCSRLSYYSTLFSFSGNGACYSVILHAFVLRVIWDQGLVGFGFLLFFIWYGLSKAGYSRRDMLCIFGVTLACALSVSSYNSVYVAIALAIAFSLKHGDTKRYGCYTVHPSAAHGRLDPMGRLELSLLSTRTRIYKKRR